MGACDHLRGAKKRKTRVGGDGGKKLKTGLKKAKTAAL